MSGATTDTWLPWSDAPRDGREVLAFVQKADRGGIVVVHCDCGAWWRRGEADDFYLLLAEPTHWMPLPGAPHAD